MNYPKYLLLALLISLAGCLFAGALTDFYETLYTATNTQEVSEAYGTFLSAESDVSQIKLATELLSGLSVDFVSDYLDEHYGKDPGNFGLNAAWILWQKDRELALRKSRWLIAVNPSNPQAFKLLYYKHLALVPTAEDGPGWFDWEAALRQDISYLTRYNKLAPDDIIAQYAHLITGLALEDNTMAEKALSSILQQKRILSEELKIELVLPDPDYRNMISSYLSRVEAAFGDLSDIQPIFSMAMQLAMFYNLDEDWQALIDTFGETNAFSDLGLVKIGLLRGYEALGMHEASYQALAGGGIQNAMEIINWWRIYDPVAGLEPYLESLKQRYPEDPIVLAVQIDDYTGPLRKLEESKRFADSFPGELYGYQSIYKAYSEIFLDEVFSPYSDEPISMQFVDDLPYWDRFEQLDHSRAIEAILDLTQNLLLKDNYQAMLDLYSLHQGWQEDFDLQLLSVVAHYWLEDFDAMFARLGHMVRSGALSYEDIVGLGESEEVLTELEGWEALLDLARTYSEESHPVEDKDVIGG